MIVVDIDPARKGCTIGAVRLAFVSVTLVAAILVSLRQSSMRVVVRVSGHWMTTIALLMIGSLFRSKM